MHKDFADPIYGFVRAHTHELKVIDSLIFQRLRYIRQLGIAYLVFPTAQHTRFDHSLGVMELSGRVYNALGFKDERLYQLVRLAGLLHDVGHPPFSHTTEVFLGDKSHEEVGKQAILDGPVGRVLKKEGFSQEEVGLIARLAFKDYKSQEEELLSKIITGEFGSDRMDYTRRDAYFCGTSYGFFDYERLLNHMEVRDSKKVISMSALRTLESFFLGRYFMYVQVYFHKVVRILSLHLLEFIQKFFGQGYFKDPNLYFSFTDNHILSKAFQNPEDITVRRIFGREHFREVFYSDDRGVFEEVKRELLSRFGEDSLRFDVCQKRIIDEDVYVSKGDRVYPVKEVSSLLRRIGDVVICRVYADRSIAEEVRECLKGLGA